VEVFHQAAGFSIAFGSHRCSRENEAMWEPQQLQRAKIFAKSQFGKCQEIYQIFSPSKVFEARQLLKK